MSRETRPDDITKLRVLFPAPDPGDVTVLRGLEYRATEPGALTFDLYRPRAAAEGARPPAVVFVAGFADPGFERHVGCKFKEMGSTVSWAELTAASGVAAVAYANREPAEDLRALLARLRRDADDLGIDGDRLGLWASSGNVPLALATLMESGRESLKCAVLCYGYTLDLDGGTGVAEAAKAWGFANPRAGGGVEDLPADVPLFVARAGRDQFPRLNEALDRFVAAGLARNLPLTFVNHPEAPHAFDLLDDSDTTRETIARILGFMRFHLRA